MFISNAEHGFGSSNLLRTSGCKTPILPITTPLTTMSADLPGKNVASGVQNILFQTKGIEKVKDMSNVFLDMLYSLHTTKCHMFYLFPITYNVFHKSKR